MGSIIRDGTDTRDGFSVATLTADNAARHFWGRRFFPLRISDTHRAKLICSTAGGFTSTVALVTCTACDSIAGRKLLYSLCKPQHEVTSLLIWRGVRAPQAGQGAAQ